MTKTRLLNISIGKLSLILIFYELYMAIDVFMASYKLLTENNNPTFQEKNVNMSLLTYIYGPYIKNDINICYQDSKFGNFITNITKMFTCESKAEKVISNAITVMKYKFYSFYIADVVFYNFIKILIGYIGSIGLSKKCIIKISYIPCIMLIDFVYTNIPMLICIFFSKEFDDCVLKFPRFIKIIYYYTNSSYIYFAITFWYCASFYICYYVYSYVCITNRYIMEKSLQVFLDNNHNSNINNNTTDDDDNEIYHRSLAVPVAPPPPPYDTVA
nr:MAG: hypothetical protein [Metapenaeopsis lamellata majanivirus]